MIDRNPDFQGIVVSASFEKLIARMQNRTSLAIATLATLFARSKKNQKQLFEFLTQKELSFWFKHCIEFLCQDF
jgi:hypothetical protein